MKTPEKYVELGQENNVLVGIVMVVRGLMYDDIHLNISAFNNTFATQLVTREKAWRMFCPIDSYTIFLARIEKNIH